MIWKILSLSQSEGDGDLEEIPFGKRLTQLRQFVTTSSPDIPKITEQLVIGILAGFLFNWWDIPVGWLLGPMIVGIVYAVIQGSVQPLPTNFMTVGKAFIGLATAVRFSPETLNIAKTYAIPILLCILLTGGMSLLHGYLLSRLSGIDRVTGLLAFIPGVASSIVAIGEEMGADAIAVALLQYIRLLLVILIIPSTATLILPANPVTQATASVATAINLPLPIYLMNLLLLAACCAVGIWGGRLLRLPASGFLGSFIVGLLVFWGLPYQLQVPQWLFPCGLLFVGLSIGVKFDRQTARKLMRAVLIEVGLLISLIFICLGIGYGFHLVTQVDTSTALLGFTPGGLEAMVATVMQLGGDTSLVLAMQLSRILIIILLGPWLVAFLMKIGKSSQ